MTEPDLSELADWRRLPWTAIVTMYINSAQKFVRENIFLFFGAGTGVAFTDWFGLREVALIGGVLLLAGLLFVMIYHRRFQYQITDDTIRVRSGFFERKELKVRFDRVQTTGMSQPIYMKPLGLMRFSLQTPGAAVTEVNIPGMPVTEAEDLRDRIASIRYMGTAGAMARAGDSEANSGVSDGADTTSIAPDATILFQASGKDLFLYGLTSNQIWIMIGFLIGPLFGFFDDQIDELFSWLSNSALFQALSLYDSPLILVLGVFIMIALLMSLLMTLSGLLSIVRFHGYLLTDESEGFKSRFGLLDQREKSLKKIKLHSIEMVQTAIGRVIDRWHLVGHQTGSSEMADLYGNSQKFLVPGVPDENIVDLAQDLDDNAFDDPDWRPIDPLFRRVLSIRWSVLLIAAAVLIQFIPTDNSTAMDGLSIGVLIFNVLLLLLIYLRCKRWGYVNEPEVVMIRSGLIGQRIVRFEPHRIQQISVRQSPLQRRRNIANVTLRLPHGEVTVPWIPLEHAQAMANKLLYRVENRFALAL